MFFIAVNIERMILMKHTDIREVFNNKDFLNNEVTVCGWVRTSRDSKNMALWN